MIEQIMIFAIGVLVAALMALLILPGLSRRAERLARRRVEARLPSSMAQIAAERDQLRAELAIEARRIEIRAEAVAAQKAQGLVEIGRRDVEITSLKAELTAQSKVLGDLEHEHAALIVSNTETRAVLERTSAELATTSQSLATREAELATLREEHRLLSERSEERRLSIAGLETTVEGLRMRISDLERATAETTVQLGETRAGLSERETQVSVLQHKLATLQHEKDERDKLIEQLRRDLAGASAAAEAAGSAHGDLTLRLAAAEARSEKAEGEVKDTGRKLHDLREELATALETSRADRAAAEGALATARAERRHLEQELEAISRKGHAVPEAPTAPALVGERPPRPVRAAKTGKGPVSPRDRLTMHLAANAGAAEDEQPAASGEATQPADEKRAPVSVASAS